MKGKLNVDIQNDIKSGFEQRCIQLLVEGYNSLKKDNSYDLSWEEERVTAEMIKQIDLCPKTSEWRIDVVAEPRIYDDAVYTDQISPKQAARIDMRLSNWSFSTKLVYHVEAKNLAENDWIKTDGSKVIASAYRGRYIDTGIDNFVSDRYKEGCLVGYVLNGDVDPIVSGINSILSTSRSRSSEVLVKGKKILKHPFCYISKHRRTTSNSPFDLYHIMLKLS